MVGTKGIVIALPKPMVGVPLTATGGVAAGETDATLPTDATTALDPAIAPLGLVGDEGVSLTRERSTDDIRAWGGQIVRTVQTEFSETATLQFLESDKAEVLKEVYGADNVTVTGTDIAIKHNEQELPPRAFVFDMKDGAKRRRLVLPNAQITATEDITYVHSDIIRYGVTITAYPDEAGNCAYEYIGTPVVTP